jgi:hypothetical protein
MCHISRVVDVTWLLTMNELSTGDRVVGRQHSGMSAKTLEWMKEDQICTYGICKGTSICFLTPPTSILLSPCQYVFPTISVYIRPPLYHIDLLATLDTPHQYIDL